jgi:hypothetical protein
MSGKLKYLSDSAIARLRADIGKNSSRYRNEGFGDLADDPAWDIGLGIEFDEELLARLDLSVPRNIVSVDLENSKIVGNALSQLTPALANEERIWVRLAHLEALEYCRARWLAQEPDTNLSAAVETHLFAPTQTGIRDDHALSRLWWNYTIARICMPEDPDSALTLILKTADIRSNFVERIWMTSRQGIASAVLRAMQSDHWITASEQNFRMFMKALNRLGGGVVFEALKITEIDAFVAECGAYARAA